MKKRITSIMALSCCLFGMTCLGLKVNNNKQILDAVITNENQYPDINAVMSMENLKALNPFLLNADYYGKEKISDINSDGVIDILDMCLAKNYYMKYDEELNSNVSMFEFEASQTYFPVNYDSEILFTVKAYNMPQDIELFSNNKKVGIMHDDGQDGDTAAGDHIYSCKISDNKANSETISYSVKSGSYLCDDISVYYFAEPDDSDIDEYNAVISNMLEIEKGYHNAKGYIEIEDEQKVLDDVKKYAYSLLESGILIKVDYNQNSIYMKFRSGIPCLYTPSIEGIAAVGDNVSVSVITCQPSEDGFDFIDKLLFTMDPEKAAQKLASELTGFSYTTSLYNSDVSCDFIRKIKPNSIILWEGHGILNPKDNLPALQTGDINNIKGNFENYSRDECIPDIGNKVYITSKFIENYCDDLENTVFFLGACHSLEDISLAKALTSKGAVAVFGTTSRTRINYVNNMLNEIMENATKINSDSGNYNTLGESLLLAQEKYGETDSWNNSAIEIYPKTSCDIRLANAQGYLKGNVYDSAGSISNAKIIATPVNEGNSINTVTDEKGKFSIKIPVGRYRVDVTKDGYEPSKYIYNVNYSSYYEQDVPLTPLIDAEKIGQKVEYNGHYYEFYKMKSVTGRTVNMYCKELGGYFAHINNSEENEFLRQSIAEFGIKYAYFGYSDEDHEGIWEWLDGKKSSFENWDYGEPNNQNNAEHYALIHSNSDKWNDGRLEYDSNHGGIVIICEYDS